MAVLFPRQRTEIVSSMSLLQHSLLLINRHKIVIERVSNTTNYPESYYFTRLSAIHVASGATAVYRMCG